MEVDEILPHVLMEDDCEVELGIIRPILNDLVGKVLEEARLKSLQNLVQINMDIVDQESAEQKKIHMVEDILLNCVSEAVKISTTFKKRKDLGTIELCLDIGDSSDEEGQKEVVPLSRSQKERKVAKVLPFEAKAASSSSDDEEHQVVTEVMLDEDVLPSPPMPMNLDNDDPLEDTNDPLVQAQPQQPTLGLRLRNFAVDPASLDSSSSEAVSSSSSWHVTEDRPQPSFPPRQVLILPQNVAPLEVQMAHLRKEFFLVYQLWNGATLNGYVPYAILTVTSPFLALKVFIPQDFISRIIPPSFVQNTPTMMFQFLQEGSLATISSVDKTISFQSSFVTNVVDLKNSIFNKAIFTCRANEMPGFVYSFKQKSLFWYATDASLKHELLGIKIDNLQLPYAVPLLGFLNPANPNPQILVYHRDGARQILALILDLVNNTNLRSAYLEQNIFDRNKTILEYKGALIGFIGMEVTKALKAGARLNFSLSALGISTEPKQNLKCAICVFENPSLNELNMHYIKTHFNLRLAKVALASRGGKCPLPDFNCQNWPSAWQDQLIHLGMFHPMIDVYLTDLKTVFQQLQVPKINKPIFKCPLRTCIMALGSFTADKILHHAIDHFHAKINTVIHDLNTSTGVQKGQCPIEHCNFKASGNSVKVDLLNHVGIHHFAVLQFLTIEYDKSTNKAMKAMKNILQAFHKALTGETYTCQDCGCLFGSLREKRLHRAKEHTTSQLIDLFNNMQKGSHNSLLIKQCGLCPMTFKLAHDGALHLAVFHGKDVAQQASITITAVTKAKTYWYYQCPICAVKINVNEDKDKSLDSLVVHMVDMHEKQSFDRILSNMNNNCPVKGCNKVLAGVVNLKKHVVKSHVTYLHEFLKKKMHGLNMKDCFITHENVGQAQQQMAQTQSDEIVILEEEPEEVLPKEYQKYLDYCKGRKVDPKNCLPTKVNSFINYAFGVLQFTKKQIKTVLTEIEKRHSNKKLSEDPMLKHTLSKIIKVNQVEQVAKKKDDFDKIFQCWSCSEDFKTVRELSTHLFEKKHNAITIGCKFCGLKKQVANSMHAEKILVFHTFNKTHLFNRFLFLQKDGKEGQRRYVNPALLDQVRCDLCSEDINDLTEHACTNKHMDKTIIVNNYVAFCDYRQICPVTCTLDDVIFYLNFAAPKTLAPERKSMNVSVFTILGVLDKIHDPVNNGQDISGCSKVTELVMKIMSNRDGPFSQYICYACPAFAMTFFDLRNHIETDEHRMNMEKNIDNKKFRCESCEKVMKDFRTLELHTYSKEHVINSKDKLAGVAKPVVAFNHSETHCYVCQVDFHNEEHFKAEDHRKKKRILDQYFGFCNKNKLNPLDPGLERIQGFIQAVIMFHSLTEVKNAIKILGVQNYIKLAPMTLEKSEQPKVDDPKSKKIDFESYGLRKEHEDLVTRCPHCNIRYKHSTYLMYHLKHNHQRKPSSYILEIMDKANEVLTCPRCMKKCLSPIVLALHHDRHQIQHKHLTCPHQCKRNFSSPAAYYSNDNCKANCLPEALKKDVDSVILEAMKRSPTTGIMGSREDFSRRYPNKNSEAAKRKRIKSSSDEEEDLPSMKKAKTMTSYEIDDEDFTPDVIETYDDIEVDDFEEEEDGKSSIISSLNSSRSSSRTSFVKEEQQVVDRNKVKPEWLALIKPCQVVIKRRSTTRAQNVEKKTKATPRTTAKIGPKSKTRPKKKNPGPRKKTAVLPTKVCTVKLDKCEKLYFCLDCEGCKDPECLHLSHTRKVIERPDLHIIKYNHGRFQDAEEFVDKLPRIKLHDYAFDDQEGGKVRVLYKKYAAANENSSPVNLFDYAEAKNCKKCAFKTDSVVFMFRHIREEHLKN